MSGPEAGKTAAFQKGELGSVFWTGFPGGVSTASHAPSDVPSHVWPRGGVLYFQLTDVLRSSAGQRRTGTTGKVVKMRLSASISSANPVNFPSSGAVQRTDPSKLAGTVWGNNSWMN